MNEDTLDTVADTLDTVALALRQVRAAELDEETTKKVCRPLRRALALLFQEYVALEVEQ